MSREKRLSAAARVRQARLELEAAEREMQRSAGSWHRRLSSNRHILAICGGFLSGAALVILPTRWWRRAGAATGSMAATVARSIVTPMLVGAVLTHTRPSPANASSPDEPIGEPRGG